MAAAFAIAAVHFTSLPVAVAQAPAPVLWLGPLTEATEANFADQGVAVQAVGCAAGDTACVAAAIDEAAASGPRVLVAPAAFTANAIALYSKGLSKETLRGVVLLNPAVEDISIPAVSSGAGPLLVLIEKTEADNAILAASLLTRAMAAQGAFARLRFVDQGMLKPEAIHAGTVLSVLHFLGRDLGGGNPDIELLRLLFDAEFAWPALPPNNRKLRAQTELVSTRPMTDAVKAMLAFHYRFQPHQIHQWPMATYGSFDLLAYRDRTAPGARYVVLRNRLGMIFVLDLVVYGAYEPEIVVGIDDESNMYRLNWFYRTNLMHSWRSERQNMSARPLGPFLSFRKPMPDGLAPPAFPVMALHLGGLEFSNENPLAAMSAYPDAVEKVITKDNQCIYCHQIEGMGGRAYHLDAMTAQPQGGYALPLADYSEEVLRSFVFDQETTAAKIDVTPNPVDEAVAEQFFAWTRTLPPTGAAQVAR